MVRAMSLKRAVAVGVLCLFAGCGGAPSGSQGQNTPPQETEPDAGGSGGRGGMGGSSQPSKVDAALDVGSSPVLDAVGSVETSAFNPPDAIAVEPDTAPAADMTPPLGEFPMEAVKSAKFDQIGRVATHLEGPTYRDGSVYFASDGNGIVRADLTGKVFKYHPRLAPVGSYLLADGSMLWCDKGYTLVQIFPDGSVGALTTAAEHTQVDFCNDVTVDGAGNIYFTDARAGEIWRMDPAGAMVKVTAGHNYPNGVEVDRESKYLYFTTGSIQRLTIPASGTGFGSPQNVGGPDKVDGMAFDAWGNLWVAIYAGGVRVFDPEKKQVIVNVGPSGGNTNLVFGGPMGDVLYTTIANRGLFRATIPGVKGFLHPGAAKYTIKRMLDLKPVNDPL
jgi:sugar lactone lactonase YvrE